MARSRWLSNKGSIQIFRSKAREASATVGMPWRNPTHLTASCPPCWHFLEVGRLPTTTLSFGPQPIQKLTRQRTPAYGRAGGAVAVAR
ncbi:hypothetical protein CRG98_035593 [Punica granatum]|uniref:Uncharacterized protein n=1 Tax=Punica granatum TaxID=22663 RepID=A0A2I0IJ21_PUNGR|nr:hypothetical protein CRG98_035593 [Punica granatum]